MDATRNFQPPLRSLFVSYSGLLGGAERLLLDAAGSLPATTVLACPEGALARAARAAGLVVLTLPERPLELRGAAGATARAGARLGAHAREIRALARELEPDVVHAWNMRSALACAAALGRRGDRPVLVFHHNDLLPPGPVARAVRAAAGRFDRVIALSHAVARDLDPHGRLAERLLVAWPGVTLSRYDPSWPAQPVPQALLLGAIVGWKRPDLALEAVALAAADGLPDLTLTVAGAPIGDEGQALLATLRRRAEQPDLRGRVHFAGRLEDPRAALRASTVLLHCAEREPFGLVMAEALAAGRPVVAPAQAGPLEIVDSSCGRLYAPGDAAAAAAALVEVGSRPDTAHELGRAGRARAQALFSREQAARRLGAAVAEAVAVAAGPSRRDRGSAPGEPGEPGTGIALVTVTHRSERELGRFLASVALHLPGAHVVVVDAGSDDATVAVARAAPGRVTVLQEDNLGFGRATNRGLAAVAEPVTVVVNPDVELLDGSLQALAREVMRPDGAERILVPAVLRPDGSRQDVAQVAPGSPWAALSALWPAGALPGPLRVRAEPWRAADPRPVGWGVGCCLVSLTATLRDLGPFHEGIFMFAEDLELGLRAGDRGVQTWFWPHGRVLHVGAHASARAYTGEPFALLARQRRAVLAARRGRRRARWDDAVQCVTFADRVLLKRLLGRDAGRERDQLAALTAELRRAPEELQEPDPS